MVVAVFCAFWSSQGTRRAIGGGWHTTLQRCHIESLKAYSGGGGRLSLWSPMPSRLRGIRAGFTRVKRGKISALLMSFWLICAAYLLHEIQWQKLVCLKVQKWTQLHMSDPQLSPTKPQEWFNNLNLQSIQTRHFTRTYYFVAHFGHLYLCSFSMQTSQDLDMILFFTFFSVLPALGLSFGVSRLLPDTTRDRKEFVRPCFLLFTYCI